MRPGCPEYQGKCLWDLHPKDIIEVIKNDIEVKHFYTGLINRPTVNTTSIAKVEKKSEPLVTIVIGVRNRDPVSVRNLLISLNNQNYKGPMKISLIDGGSSMPYRSKYKIMARNFNVQYKYLPLQFWNKPLTLNYGIRNSNTKSKYIFCIDADMIVPPTVVKTVVNAFKETPEELSFAVVRTLKFKDGTTLAGRVNNWNLLKSLDDITDPKIFNKIKKEAYITGFGASGGLQAASREWFFNMRGYDEDIFLWGAPDTDMHRRALFNEKLRCIYFTPVEDEESKKWEAITGWPKSEVRINKEMFLIHQWHCFRDVRLHKYEFVQSTWNYNRDIYQRRIRDKLYPRNKRAYWGRLEGRKIVEVKTCTNPHLEWRYET